MFQTYQEVRSGVAAVAGSTLQSTIPPINFALSYLAHQLVPARAAVVHALTEADGAAELAAALELMNLAVHTLHTRLDDEHRAVLGLGVGGDVLVGDYLSSSAFRLLVRCTDMRVMATISGAVQRACEQELAVLHLDAEPATMVAQIMQCAAPLGQVAGQAAMLLAQRDDEQQQLGGRLGMFVTIAQALIDRSSGASEPLHTLLLPRIRGAISNAQLAAREWQLQAGSDGPLRLCAALEQQLAALR